MIWMDNLIQPETRNWRRNERFDHQTGNNMD